MEIGNNKDLKDLVRAELANFKEDPDSIGFRLRLHLSALILELLEKNNWSQKELAEAAGLSESFVSRIINCDSNCQFDTAGKMLFALGLRENDVILQRNYLGSIGYRNEQEDQVKTTYVGGSFERYETSDDNPGGWDIKTEHGKTPVAVRSFASVGVG